MTNVVTSAKACKVCATRAPSVPPRSQASAPANDNAEYEHYDRTCGAYDQTRAPIGVEIHLGMFAQSPRPLAEQRILDAGCGTGNYSAAIAPHVAAMCCIDREPGMLQQARAKLARSPRAQFARASVLELPFARGCFDGVMLNQVAHHLEADGANTRYARLARFCELAARALRPGGVLVINTSTPEQVVRGYWWADLIPDAVAVIARRYPPLPALRELLLRAGFASVTSYVSLDGVLQSRNYLDPEGPLKASWRAGDSTWSLASEHELQDAQARVKAMLAAGTMGEYLERRERERAAVGQTTFVCARKGA